MDLDDLYDTFLYDCHVANKRLSEEDWLFFGKEVHHVNVPNRDGGVLCSLNSLPLTTYQHWVAGVLQSELLQKCCFAFVPSNSIPLWLETVRVKWEKENKTEGGRAAQASKTPEQKQKERKKATETLLKNNPYHFSACGKKARLKETREIKAARAHSLHTERYSDGRSVRGVALNQKTNSTRVRCLVTGHVTTPGPLSRYQKARGIDTSLRETVSY